MRSLYRFNQSLLHSLFPSTIVRTLGVVSERWFDLRREYLSTLHQTEDSDLQPDNQKKRAPKLFVFKKKPQTALDLLEDAVKGVSVDISEEGQHPSSSPKRLSVPTSYYCSKVLTSSIDDPQLVDRVAAVSTQLLDLNVELTEQAYVSVVTALLQAGKPEAVLSLWTSALQLHRRKNATPPATLLTTFINCAVNQRQAAVVVGVLEAMKKAGTLPRRDSLVSLVQALVHMDEIGIAHAVADWMRLSGFPTHSLLDIQLAPVQHSPPDSNPLGQQIMQSARHQVQEPVQSQGQIPHSVCSSILHKCARAASLCDAWHLWRHLQDSGTPLDCELYTSMMHVCNKCGDDVRALSLYRSMQRAGVSGDGVLYAELFSALRNHSVESGEEVGYTVRAVWQDVCALGLRLNGLTLAAAVQAHLAAGVVDDGVHMTRALGVGGGDTKAAAACEVYHSLLLLTGKRKQFSAMKQVYQHMKDAGVPLTAGTASVLLYCHSLKNSTLRDNWLLLSPKAVQGGMDRWAEGEADGDQDDVPEAALNLPEAVEQGCLHYGVGAEDLVHPMLQNEWGPGRQKRYTRTAVSASPATSEGHAAASDSKTQQPVWQYLRRTRYRLVDVYNAVLGGLTSQGHCKDAWRVYIHMLKMEVTPNQTTLRCMLMAAVNSPSHVRLHNIIQVLEDGKRLKVTSSTNPPGDLWDKRTKALMMKVGQSEVDSILHDGLRPVDAVHITHTLRDYDSMASKLRRLKHLLDTV